MQTKTGIFAVVSLMLATGCTAAVEGSGGEPDDDEERGEGGGGDGSTYVPGTSGGGTGGAPDVKLEYAPAAVRRLTTTEVRNSVRDVFFGGKATDALAMKFGREVRRHDFDNNHAFLDASLGFVENVQTFSENVGAAVAARLSELLPCAAKLGDETSCAQTFADTFGRRMFRRPVTTEERTRLMGVFKAARARGTFPEAIAIVVEAMIQSPRFLFRTELGGDSSDGNLVRLSPFESASALSYFIWRSAPDDELLDAAESGELARSEGQRKQVQRLLKDPRAKDGLRDFFLQLLEVEQLGAGLVNKSDASFNEALAASMFEETSRFIDHVLWEGEGTFSALLQSPTTFVNKGLAQLYGIAGPANGFAKTDLDAKQRSGFLTQPGFLAVMTSPSGFNPIFPGLFVRRKLFCQSLAIPPDNIPQVEKDPNLTTRERFAKHSEPGSCQGCHRLMDPVGFGFERFDELGRYRTEEKAGTRMVPLTGEGNLEDTDVDGPFTGPVQLGERLAKSADVRSCLTTQLLRFAVGRDIADEANRLSAESKGIELVAKSPAKTMMDLVAEVVSQPAFFTRNTKAVSGVQQ